MSLPLTALHLMADVTVENLGAENASGVVVRRALLEKCERTVGIVISSVRMVYYVPFQRLLVAVEKSGEDSIESVLALICDPSHNARWIAKLSALERDRFGLHDMSQFVQLRLALMDLGGHGPTSCSQFKFKTLYEQIVGKVEEVVEHEEVLLPGMSATQATTVSKGRQKCCIT